MARLVFFPGFLLEHLGLAGSGCEENAPPLPPPAGSARYPVLVYSHGQGGNMDMGTYFLRQIASFGIVVVAVEHQDGSASTGDPENPRPFNLARGQKGVQYRALEAVAVGEALAQPGSAAERLGGDARRLLVGGHSYGGPTAIYAAAARPELFTGLVLHDPALGGGLPRPPQPVFSVVGDQYASLGGLVQEVRRVSAGEGQQAGGPWAGAWHYEGISHGNFVDAPLWAPLLIMRALGLLLIPAAGPADPAEAHVRLAEAAAAFAAACAGAAPGAAAEAGVRPQPPFKPL